MYELIWISIKFGGVMTSLILPKLMRSATRDGIFDLRLWPATGRTVIIALNETTPLLRSAAPEPPANFLGHQFSRIRSRQVSIPAILDRAMPGRREQPDAP